MASGSLGALVVSMAVDTAKFQGDLGKAAAVAERRMKNIKETATRALGALTIAASATGAALVAMLGKGLRDADELGKLAKQVGTTVEQLSALRYAAQLSGVSQDDLATAMRKLASTAVDAANGVKGSEAAFRSLGVQVTDANGRIRSTDELVKDIADAFSKAPDSITKTAIATDLFGKSGAKLIPLLDEGRAGLGALAAEADKLGLIIDSKTARAAERFNDNMDRMRLVATGFSNLLAAELGQNLANLSDELLRSADHTSRLRDLAATAANVLRGFAAAGIFLASSLDTAGKNLGALGAALKAFWTFDFDRSFEIVKERAGDFEREMRASLDLIGSLYDDAGAAIEAKAPQIADQLSLPITKTAENWREKVREIVEMERFLASIGQVPFSLIDVETTEARTADPELARMLNEQAAEAQKVLDELFRDVNKDFESTSEELSTYAEQAARNIQSHFADFLFDPFEKGIQGMLKGFIDVLRRMVANAAAARILEGLEGKMNSFLDGLFGGIGNIFGGGKVSAGGMTGPGMSFGRGFASGGFMSPGSWGIVGERGPELAFAGNQGATIVPFEKARTSAAAPVVNVTVNNNIDARHSTPDAAQYLIAAMPRILDQHGSQIEHRIIEGIRRNRYAL